MMILYLKEKDLLDIKAQYFSLDLIKDFMILLAAGSSYSSDFALVTIEKLH